MGNNDYILDALSFARTHWVKDFFKDFFMNPLDEIHYNKLFSTDKRFRAAMNNDITADVARQLEFAVKIGSNQIIQINSLPNSGKSLLAQAVGNKLREYVVQYKEEDPEVYITFDTGETVITIEKMKDREICIQDEIENIEGEGAKAIIQRINNLLRTIRATQKFFIFCSPTYEPFDAVNFILEPIGKYRKFLIDDSPENMITRAMVYYCTRKHELVPMGIVYFSLAAVINTKAYKKYLKRKMKNIKQLQEHKGFRGVLYDEDSVRKYARELYEYAMKQSWNGKQTYLKTYIRELKIPGNTAEIRHILNTCTSMYKNDTSFSAIREKTEKIIIEKCVACGSRSIADIRAVIVEAFPEYATMKTLLIDLAHVYKTKIDSQLLTSYVKELTLSDKDLKENRKKKRNFIEFVEPFLTRLKKLNVLEKSIILEAMKGQTNDEIRKSLKLTKSIAWLRNIVKKHKAKIIPNLAEMYIAYRIGVKNNAGTGSSEPDVVDKKNFAWSVKFRTLSKHNMVISAQEECNPEYKHHIKNGKKHYFLAVINPRWDFEPRIVVVTKDDKNVLVSNTSRTMDQIVERYDYLKDNKYLK